MMPLTFAKPGVELTIVKVGGKEEVKNHLESIGFLPGKRVTVVNQVGGNVIVMLMDYRIAISKEMANKISVQED